MISLEVSWVPLFSPSQTSLSTKPTSGPSSATSWPRVAADSENFFWFNSAKPLAISAACLVGLPYSSLFGFVPRLAIAKSRSEIAWAYVSAWVDLVIASASLASIGSVIIGIPPYKSAISAYRKPRKYFNSASHFSAIPAEKFTFGIKAKSWLIFEIAPKP